METWYRTDRYKNAIEQVTVTKRTAKYVTVVRKDWDGRDSTSRDMIRTSYTNYFPTLEEAKGHLLDTHERAVKYAEARLSAAKSELANLRKRIANDDILKT